VLKYILIAVAKKLKITISLVQYANGIVNGRLILLKLNQK